MAKYLDREKVFQAIFALDSWGSDDNDTSFLDTGEVWDALAEIETADVRPERHGQWIDGGNGVLVCSECGEEHAWEDYRATYCEDCGAKMDGKDGESV